MTVDESPVSPPNAAPPTTPKPTLAKKQSQTEQVKNDVSATYTFTYSNHLNSQHLKSGIVWTIWIPDRIGVWYSNGKVAWLGRPFEYQTLWTINSFFSPVFRPPFHLTLHHLVFFGENWTGRQYYYFDAWTLSSSIMEDRLRRASGPVLTLIPLLEWSIRWYLYYWIIRGR